MYLLQLSCCWSPFFKKLKNNSESPALWLLENPGKVPRKRDCMKSKGWKWRKKNGRSRGLKCIQNSKNKFSVQISSAVWDIIYYHHLLSVAGHADNMFVPTVISKSRFFTHNLTYLFNGIVYILGFTEFIDLNGTIRTISI